MSTSTTSATKDRALTLLGQGIGPEMCAAALGVTVSAISQLLSDTEFSARVAELRFSNLSKHNDRDNRYDSMEDKLLDRMEDLVPFMMKPFEVLRAIQTINGAKRRGSSAPEMITQQHTVVPLVMPAIIFNKFTQQNIQVNINNQVIKAGDQELITVQSTAMDRMVASRKEATNVKPTQLQREESNRAGA